ncbi:uncharacterized protein LOC112198711 [Rosa chinensis]|uniref:uncharacterized protein LOC112198711 n=1 Tax=Rosa chinensis TaxID=74649 RepID=UPI000D090C61|nr:uncharacterized protein LOC112198711 [Rosa chinensis]
MLPVATDPLTNRYEDPRDDTDSDKERPGAVEDIEEVVLSEQFPDRIVKIGTKLAPTIRENLITFLRSNASAFAWSYEDMTGIPTDIAMQNLSIVPFSELGSDISRWLANVVMVPKKASGSWRIGYNQIRMNPADKEHTAFTTDKGLYCYQVMPFGLKNAGATYQRLVNSMFADVIGNIMELNPQKCTFRVEVGKFLRYIISHRGIEMNPKKVQAILDMISPTYRNNVQSLTGKVAALSRFISRLTDKCTPFFKLLKTQHVEVIAWFAEHEAAFLSLKAYLAAVPLLYKPVPGEMLYIYLAASSTAVSSALIRRDSDCVYPVYYAGKGYTGAESRYPDIEKPRTTIKGQAAADFIYELIPPHDPPSRTPEPQAPNPQPPSTWRLYVDGASNKKISGAGILLISPEDQVYEYALKFAFKASNNAVEYEALIAGQGNFEAKEPHMSSYQALAKALVQRCTSYVITQIPRAKSDKAEALAKIAATSPSPAYGDTKVEILEKPSTSKAVSEIFTVDHTDSWMDLILKYMVDSLASDDKVEARRL